MSYNDIRAAVIKASLDVQKKGLIRGTSGNISLRSEDGQGNRHHPLFYPL